MQWSLFGFKMKMIVASFQRWGIVLVLRAMLYMFVRYLMASGPRCLRCLMLPSGPVELLFMLFEMANCTCVEVSQIFLVERFLIVWYTSLFVLLVLYRVTFVNCSQAFVLSRSVMAVLVLKQMLLLCCVGGFLLNKLTCFFCFLSSCFR